MVDQKAELPLAGHIEPTGPSPKPIIQDRANLHKVTEFTVGWLADDFSQVMAALEQGLSHQEPPLKEPLLVADLPDGPRSISYTDGAIFGALQWEQCGRATHVQIVVVNGARHAVFPWTPPAAEESELQTN
jgi:hypothetical protein